ALETVRSRAGQQLKEDHPERVDVAGGGYGCARDLLRRGVLGGKGPAAEPRQLTLARLACGKKFRDSEIPQAALPVRGDQDVGGLQVAMDDKTRVRVLHRAQHLKEQAEACTDIASVLVAIHGDRSPYDVLQREIRLLVGGDPCVVQTRDVGV